MDNQGTLAIRVQGVPYPIVFGDWTHDKLYHTVEFQGGDQAALQAFVGSEGNPIPGGTRVLTSVDTNLIRGGDTGLQMGYEMLIYSVQIQVVREMSRAVGQAAFTLEDTATLQLSRPPHVGGYDPAVVNGGVMFDFLRKTFFRFTVNTKTQTEGPADEFPQGSGVHVFSTGTSVEVAGNGPPSPRDQSALVLPIWIRDNLSFRALLAPQAALGLVNGAGPAFIGGYTDWSGLPAVAQGFDVRVTLEGLLKRPVV